MQNGILDFERQLTRLLAQVGTVDPASAGFQALLADCVHCTAGLEREVQLLAGAPVAERNRARARLERLAGLNALVQDAVRREREGVAELITQTRLVRESLAHADQPGDTGDSCDVRG